MEHHFLLTSEDTLVDTYAKDIQPFWLEQVECGHFVGTDNIVVAYAYVLHPQAKGVIVVSSGRIESYIKYKELVFDLYQNGYSVFILDHRGQGLSGRMTDNPHMGYVRDFTDYVDDLELFMQKVVLPNCQHQPSLLCHSMGCAIGILYCLRYPQRIKKAVFSAPMFGIRPALPTWLASVLVNCHLHVAKLLGHEYAYFLGQKGYISQEFKDNKLTQSPTRYAIFRQEYALNPQVQLGGVTSQWLHAAALAMDKIEQQATDFSVPALVIQAGGDEVVDNNRQSRVVSRMANVRLLVIKHAKHELLLEKDCYREPTIQAALAFLSDE